MGTINDIKTHLVNGGQSCAAHVFFPFCPFLPTVASLLCVRHHDMAANVTSQFYRFSIKPTFCDWQDTVKLSRPLPAVIKTVRTMYHIYQSRILWIADVEFCNCNGGIFAPFHPAPFKLAPFSWPTPSTSYLPCHCTQGH